MLPHVLWQSSLFPSAGVAIACATRFRAFIPSQPYSELTISPACLFAPEVPRNVHLCSLNGQVSRNEHLQEYCVDRTRLSYVGGCKAQK